MYAGPCELNVPTSGTRDRRLRGYLVSFARCPRVETDLAAAVFLECWGLGCHPPPRPPPAAGAQRPASSVGGASPCDALLCKGRQDLVTKGKMRVKLSCCLPRPREVWFYVYVYVIDEYRIISQTQNGQFSIDYQLTGPLTRVRSTLLCSGARAGAVTTALLASPPTLAASPRGCVA